MIRAAWAVALGLLAGLLGSGCAAVAAPPDTRAVEVAPGVFMLRGAGGEVAVLHVGDAHRIDQAAGEQRAAAKVEHGAVARAAGMTEMQHFDRPADELEHMARVELAVGLEHRRAAHGLVAERAHQRPQAAFAPCGH